MPQGRRPALAVLLLLGLAPALARGDGPRAIVGARVVVAPGNEIPRGTVVMRDGRITHVGPADEVRTPEDAEAIEGAGLTVYAGFLDLYTNVGHVRPQPAPSPTLDESDHAPTSVPRDERNGLTPEFQVASVVDIPEAEAAARRASGFTAVVAAPAGPIAAGQGALVSLTGRPRREAVIRPVVALHLQVEPPIDPARPRRYPASLMGAVAHLRQAMLDSEYHQTLKHPPFDPALDAFHAARTKALPVWWEANTRTEIHRVLDLAEEFGTTALIVGASDADRAADRLAATQTPVVLRLDLPDGPRLGVAAALEAKGIAFAFSGMGLDRPGMFRSQLLKALARGLSPDAALAALTTTAARLAGVEKELGSIDVGKRAHLLLMTGRFHERETQLRAAFVDGERLEVPPGELPEPSAPIARVEKAPPREAADGVLLVKDATVLTGTRGTLPRGSILIRDGKIAEVAERIDAPAGATVIEAAGMFAMPGIIDTHVHIAMQGGSNESSHSITAEVRAADVLDGDNVNLVRQIAGGVTTSRILNGSDNVINGQEAVVKHRVGRRGRELVVADAPAGIKYALGENPASVAGRFPNTRMGVYAVIEQAYADAKAYRAEWQAFRDGRRATAPRRDLRLEALAEVVDGTRKVHCHAYRADEMLQCLSLHERNGIKVGSFQHGIEGYKIARDLARADVPVSTFADWWAYKYEAFDGIPFNAPLLADAGVSVTLKSDDAELARRLPGEAAKMLKYSDVSEDDALAMITINGAKNVGLAHRIGSIEVGKDADIALFNAHPFDAFARCELTIIDGAVEFRRDGAFAPRPGGPSLALASAEARARDVPVPVSPRGVYALRGATVHPVSGPDVVDGTVVIADGKIAAVGGPETAVPPDALAVDLHGLDVWPGLIDAGTTLGLFEVGHLRMTHDFADIAASQPELRASLALNPNSALIPVTRANGVLTAYVRPTGGRIAGQGCVIDLDGRSPREMVVADPVGLNVVIPLAVEAEPDAPLARQAELDRQRRERAREVEALADRFAKGRGPHAASDLRAAALAPYARGEKLVVLHANYATEIGDALDLVERFHLKAAIAGGINAGKVAGRLKGLGVPVLVAGTFVLPTEADDPYDAAFTNPLKLHEAGVRFAIYSSDMGPVRASAPRNLPYEAAQAVAYGLPEAAALRAVTLAPAEILGVSDRLGSIEVGKRANLVVTAGSILQPTSRVKLLFLAGRPVAPESRHTRLRDQYRDGPKRETYP